MRGVCIGHTKHESCNPSPPFDHDPSHRVSAFLRAAHQTTTIWNGLRSAYRDQPDNSIGIHAIVGMTQLRRQPSLPCSRHSAYRSFLALRTGRQRSSQPDDSNASAIFSTVVSVGTPFPARSRRPTLGTCWKSQAREAELAAVTQWLGHAVILAIAAGETPEREARALAELERTGPHHALALELLVGGVHAVRFAVELAEAVLAAPQSESKKLTTHSASSR